MSLKYYPPFYIEKGIAKKHKINCKDIKYGVISHHKLLPLDEYDFHIPNYFHKYIQSFKREKSLEISPIKYHHSTSCNPGNYRSEKRSNQDVLL